LLSVHFAPATGVLKEFVSLFYRLETDGSPQQLIERADIPHVRFNFGGDGRIRFSNGASHALTGQYIIGAKNQYAIVEGEMPGHVFGFGLLPAGWAAFTSASAIDHANHVRPTSEVMGSLALALQQNLNADDSLSALVEKAEAILGPVAANAQAIPFWFFNAVESWMDSAVSPELNDLVAATGLSKNRTEHMIRTYFGAPPALFVRKNRALRIANRIAHGEGDWQDYIDSAYCDQSHYIREIKHFTGYTPVQLRRSVDASKNILFQRRRALSDGAV
jgi:AraC-like DNA-binding protein